MRFDENRKLGCRIDGKEDNIALAKESTYDCNVSSYTHILDIFYRPSGLGHSIRNLFLCASPI